MKIFLWFVIILFLATYPVKAQWFNPYFNPGRSLQDAYNQGYQIGKGIARGVQMEMNEKEGERKLIDEDYEQAWNCFAKAADMGSAKGMYWLALMLECGWGGRKTPIKPWNSIRSLPGRDIRMPKIGWHPFAVIVFLTKVKFWS